MIIQQLSSESNLCDALAPKQSSVKINKSFFTLPSTFMCTAVGNIVNKLGCTYALISSALISCGKTDEGVGQVVKNTHIPVDW